MGFSKFAELRPKHCTLAGASGTHTVCVCTIHQNVKLMILAAKLPDLTAHSLSLQTYHHCLAHIMCNPPQPICYFGDCNSCPGITKLNAYLLKVLDENMIDNVVFKGAVAHRDYFFPKKFEFVSLCSFICLQAVYQLSGPVCKATWNGCPS